MPWSCWLTVGAAAQPTADVGDSDRAGRVNFGAARGVYIRQVSGMQQTDVAYRA